MNMNLAAVLTFALLLWNATPFNDIAHKTTPANLVPLEFSQLPRPGLLAANHKYLYIFDDSSNRLAIIERQRHAVKLVGSIGTGPGEFFHPTAMAATDHEIVFFDIANNRLQFFNSDGQHLSECYLPNRISSRAIALMDDGTVLLNDLHKDSFLTAFDRNCKVLYSIGQPTTLSALYSDELSNRNEAYKHVANSVWIATDHENNIYVSHLVALVVSKYSPKGTLLWSRKLEDRESQFRSYSPQKGGMSTGMGDVQFPILTKGIILDSKNRLLVLCAVDLFTKDRLFALSTDGQMLWSQDLQVPKGSLFKITKQANDIFLTSIFSNGVYRVEHHP